MENADAEPFRLLNDEDFARLNTAEKVAYMKRAMEAQSVLNRQIAAGLFQLAPKDPE